MAELVNKTLAEEERKRQEEKEKKEDGKKTDGQEDGDERGTVEKKEGQDEACPPVNYTCPSVKPCPSDKDCPPCEDCESCKDCEICPEVRPCQPCRPCGPCSPCPVGNSTVKPPSTSECPEPSSMTVPVAMAIGACASLLVTGVATALGLLLRYVPPTVSGFLILAIIVVIWYLCSQYPETARELGGRAVAVLREAAMALSHRLVEALQRHQDQVGFPVLILVFYFPRLSSMFHLKNLH